MTLDQLIEKLQALRGDDGSGGQGHNGNLLVWFDSGHKTVVRPIKKAAIAFDAATKDAEVWLS